MYDFNRWFNFIIILFIIASSISQAISNFQPSEYSDPDEIPQIERGGD